MLVLHPASAICPHQSLNPPIVICVHTKHKARVRFTEFTDQGQSFLDIIISLLTVDFLTDCLSRAREGLELVEGTRRRLYSKVVAGLGPGPRRRAGAMVEALCAPGRQGPKNRSEIQSNLLN